MPVTIVTGSMKYKDGNGQYQDITGLKGSQGPAGPKGDKGDTGEAPIDDTAGTGDTDKVWSADKSSSAVEAKYTKPSGGIPASDLAAGVIPSVPVQDVQVNGVSVVNQGVANISLPKTQNVSGTTPSITAVSDTRYICGECAILDIAVPASGIIDVVFESGSTATVLTVTSAKVNTTIKWANGFDPTSLDANTVYEINIMDGEWGMAAEWT